MSAPLMGGTRRRHPGKLLDPLIPVERRRIRHCRPVFLRLDIRSGHGYTERTCFNCHTGTVLTSLFKEGSGAHTAHASTDEAEEDEMVVSVVLPYMRVSLLLSLEELRHVPPVW